MDPSYLRWEDAEFSESDHLDFIWPLLRDATGAGEEMLTLKETPEEAELQAEPHAVTTKSFNCEAFVNVIGIEDSGRSNFIKTRDFGVLYSPVITDFDALDYPVKIGTRKYMAPEVHVLAPGLMESNLWAPKADIYSFAMTCYEIVTGRVPEFTRRQADQAVTPHTALANKLRTSIIHELYKELAGNTAHRPRPTIDKLKKRFKERNAGQLSGRAGCLDLKPKLEGADSFKAVKSCVTGMLPGTDIDQNQEIGDSEIDSDGLSDNEGLSDGSSATHAFYSNEEIYPRISGRKRRTVDEDDLTNKIAQTINHKFENAFNSAFLPLVSALQRREEDEQKHREQMLALEKAKLALERKKFLFKRRRVALSQPNPRARSGHKKQGKPICANHSAHLKPDPRASAF